MSTRSAFSEREKSRAAYAYFTRITTRWIDNDIYGHINNVTYYQFFDTVTNEYLVREGGLNIHDATIVGFIVASSCEYLAPVAHPSVIEAGMRVMRLGNRSVQYGVGIFEKDQSVVSALGTFTHVFVDRSSGQSVAIPAPIRAALQRLQD